MSVFGFACWRLHTGYLLQIKTKSDAESNPSAGEAQLALHMILTLCKEPLIQEILGFVASPQEVGSSHFNPAMFIDNPCIYLSPCR